MTTQKLKNIINSIHCWIIVNNVGLNVPKILGQNVDNFYE